MVFSCESLSCLSWTGIAIVSLTALYFYFTRNFNYWSSRGVRGPKPWPLLGSFGDIFFNTLHDNQENYLKEFGLIYGTYEGSRPVLNIAEPELIKDILIRDFHKFVNRRSIDINDEMMSRLITILRDDEWKRVRSVVSQAFSSGKMRKMHVMIEDCVNGIENVLMDAAKNNKEIELKSLMGNYTMEVIGRCAFATKIDSYNDPKNPFIQYALKIFNTRISSRGLFFVILPSLMKWLNISVFDPEVKDFFTNAVRTIIKKRSDEKVKNHDFLQLMVDAQKKKIDHDHDHDHDDEKDAESHHGYENETKPIVAGSLKDIEITENDIISTSLIFFLAGYETTASLLSFLFYSLAVNDEHQQTLYEEILKRESNGKIDYDTIARMPFLDACVSETLRLYNPAVQTEREASEDYPLGNTEIVIKKGTLVHFPVHAIHHNPDFYPSPHRFDPNRFTPENRDNLIPYTYLPFGAGPRNCVGMRFALMEAKTAIVRVVRKFKFVRSENTKVPLKFVKLSGLMKATDITVGVELRE